jgi:hypothetical protein
MAELENLSIADREIYTNYCRLKIPGGLDLLNDAGNVARRSELYIHKVSEPQYFSLYKSGLLSFKSYISNVQSKIVAIKRTNYFCNYTGSKLLKHI